MKNVEIPLMIDILANDLFSAFVHNFDDAKICTDFINKYFPSAMLTLHVATNCNEYDKIYNTFNNNTCIVKHAKHVVRKLKNA